MTQGNCRTACSGWGGRPQFDFCSFLFIYKIYIKIHQNRHIFTNRILTDDKCIHFKTSISTYSLCKIIFYVKTFKKELFVKVKTLFVRFLTEITEATSTSLFSFIIIFPATLMRGSASK
jgi:hypothetical protein